MTKKFCDICNNEIKESISNIEVGIYGQEYIKVNN